MTVRFVISADPAAIAAAGVALAEHGVFVEHVADDPSGLRHFDVTDDDGDERDPGTDTLGKVRAAWTRRHARAPFPSVFYGGRLPLGDDTP
ncbi:hypothetical protein [Amycolatopsis kentuckyensis]|uniref:hypothetical protein n=1 Tax=Amycolatopsis kentuckyensis TaxID=218823 RepID=UPI00356AE2FB